MEQYTCNGEVLIYEMEQVYNMGTISWGKSWGAYDGEHILGREYQHIKQYVKEVI